MSDNRELYKSATVVLSGYPSEIYSSALTDWSCLRTQTRAQNNAPRTECLWLSPNIDTRQRKLFAVTA